MCGKQFLEREPGGVLNTRLMGHLDLESQLVALPDDHRGGAIPGTSIMDALAQGVGTLFGIATVFVSCVYDYLCTN